MRSSFWLTLLFLLPVLLPGSGCSPDTEPVYHSQTAITLQAPAEEALGPEALTRLRIPSGLRPVHLAIALGYEGTTELTGNNDGPEVEQFLSAVRLKAGNPYCAAFVSFVLDSAGRIRPVDRPQIRSALASDFITDLSIETRRVLRGTEQIPPGTILIWRKGNTIYGHTGFVVEWDQAKGTTIEANTSSGTYGSQRDGEGVFRRRRSLQPGNYFRITHFTPVIYEQRN